MERYRYYQCHLTATSWKCQPTESIVPDTFFTFHENKTTMIVPIKKWIPTFFDPLILSTKVPTGILVLSHSPFAAADLRIKDPYTHTSLAAGPKPRAAKSSE